MSQEETRKKLVSLLDRKVFEPILRASESRFPEADRQRLAQVKRSTGSERKRYYEDYRTPTEVRENYLSDLQSSAGKRISAELERLGLPTLSSVKDELLDLCEELGVGPREG